MYANNKKKKYQILANKSWCKPVCENKVNAVCVSTIPFVAAWAKIVSYRAISTGDNAQGSYKKFNKYMKEKYIIARI